MKSEQVEGVVEQVAGKAQSAVGRLFSDSKLEAEGTGRQASGQLTQAYGDAFPRWHVLHTVIFCT